MGTLRCGKSQLIAIACVTAVAIPAVSQTLQKKSGPVAVPSETIRIADRNQVNQKLEVTNSRFSQSVFDNCRAEGVKFRNVAMPGLSFTDADLSGAKIEDANLSDLEIDGAQRGGASFHHIGLPPKGHPAYVEGARQRPLRFEECDLQGSTIKNSDLKGLAITGCAIQGMTINGISVEAMLAAYREKNRETK
jgi:uncharacterized protein YjbI with pentapeptide repeats